MIEFLETRSLLSAVLDAHVLRVSGTDESDVIQFSRRKDALVVEINAEVEEFSLASLRSVSVHAGDGDDLVLFRRRASWWETGVRAVGGDKKCEQPCVRPVYRYIGADIDGGAGDDTIVGAAGESRIDGGAGNDRLSGSFFGTTFRGGEGDDTIRGGVGEDRLIGGPGHDRLFGGDGDDMLSGGSGNDFLSGGSGIDELNGGEGRDRTSDRGSDSAYDLIESIENRLGRKSASRR